MSSTVWFSHVVRIVSEVSRLAGHVVPTFACPPRTTGAPRTIGRSRRGTPVVRVAVHGRAPDAVLADLVESVVLVNGLTGVAAVRARTALWSALREEVAAA